MSDFLALLRQRSERPLMAPPDPVEDVAFFERKVLVFARLAAEEPHDVERARVAAGAIEQLAEARSRLAQEQQTTPEGPDHSTTPAEVTDTEGRADATSSEHAQTSMDTADSTSSAGSVGTGGVHGSQSGGAAEVAAGAGTSGVQVRAVQVLGTVLAAAARLGLAAASWLVHVEGDVSGQLRSGDRAGLRAWADAFGAVVDWQRHQGRHPRIVVEVNGVSVEVWTALDSTTTTATPATTPAPVVVGGERDVA